MTTYTDSASLDEPLGSGMSCPAVTSGSSRAQRDVRAWCLALQGAAETVKVNGQDTASSVGTLSGGRGCIESLGDSRYMITVAWQGMQPLVAPAESVACGAGSFNGASGSACSNDRCRRIVTTIVRVGSL
jgi:type IV pilus assembly protein PilV